MSPSTVNYKEFCSPAPRPICFVLAAVIDTTVVWNIAYVVVALVSIPNLIAMFALRKEMKLLSDEFKIK